MDEQPVETTLYSLADSAPQPVQRRKDERHLSLFRVGTLLMGDRRELCLIRNVSAGGMMLRAYSRVAEGDNVAVELKQGQPIVGTVRWVTGDTVGITFAEPIDVIDLISTSMEGPRPRMPRVQVACSAWVRQDGTIYRTKALDISQGGLKVLSSNDLAVGAEVIVSLNGLPPAAGTVRWRDADAYGITFHRPLALPAIVAWLQQQQERGAAAG